MATGDEVVVGEKIVDDENVRAGTVKRDEDDFDSEFGVRSGLGVAAVHASDSSIGSGGLSPVTVSLI